MTRRQTVAQRRALARAAERVRPDTAAAYKAAPKGERLSALKLAKAATTLALKFGRPARRTANG